jgi:agmatinase
VAEVITVAPRREFQSFHDFPLCLDLDRLEADVAILGIPYGAAYSVEEISNDQINAPTHIRRHCERALRGLDRWDFDIGGTLLDGRPIKVVDCGDIVGDPADPAMQRRRAELAVRKILAAGALPIVLGGDHSTPIPVFRAYEGRGPITLVQVDAHIDWRDEINGVREGLSSPIRRASEMGHFDKIFQIGLRAAGSARTEEVEAALDWARCSFQTLSCSKSAWKPCWRGYRTVGSITSPSMQTVWTRRSCQQLPDQHLEVSPTPR